MTTTKANGKANGKSSDKPEAPVKAAKFESIFLPGKLIAAALACASTEETRFALQSIALSRSKVKTEDGQDPQIEIAATDGHRLFVALVSVPEVPAWMPEKGHALISVEDLKTRLVLIRRTGSGDDVRFNYAVDEPFMTVSDPAQLVSVRQSMIEASYPNYSRIIESLDVFGENQNGLRPLSFNGQYLAEVGVLAKILATDPKSPRVDMFVGNQDGKANATVFTFPGVPGAALILMPMSSVDFVWNPSTRQLLGKPVSRHVSALRAHLTRNAKALKKAKTSAEKDALKEVVDGFKTRIAEALQTIGDKKALPAPENAKTDGDDQGKEKPEASVADGPKGPEVEPPSDTEQAITSGETTPPVTAKANGESKTTKTGQRPRDLRAKGAKAKAETETGATA